MGLTIHYSLELNNGDEAEARRMLGKLRHRALELPFARVGELADFTGTECDVPGGPGTDAMGWLLIQANQYIERDSETYAVPAERVIGFMTGPGKGCEPANFGLCLYPATFVDREGREMPTELGFGWSWSSFCKTQYASNPEAGGIESFLRCHLSIVKLLDYAKELGILKSVHDESGYWEHRDVAALVADVGRWNSLMAGFVGKMKDLMGDRGIQSEITKFPNFEHLEADGRKDENQEPGD
jgi:hypothetical protein